MNLPPAASSGQIDSSAAFDRRLPALWRERQRFVILDSAFDGGRRFLLWWQAWQRDPHRCAQLHVISASPEIASGCAAAVHRDDDGTMRELAAELARSWPPVTPNVHRLAFERGRVQWLLMPLPLSEALRELTGEVDAFLLSADAQSNPVDPERPGGCAPCSNPPFTIEPRLAKALARLASPEATLNFDGPPTASNAESHRALRSAGFAPALPSSDSPADQDTSWRYAPGFVPRRSTSRNAKALPTGEAHDVLVIGGGLAGCAMAWALAEQGLRSTVFERCHGPALETSGNPAGLFHGIVNPQDGAHARFNRAAALEAQRAVSIALAGHGAQGSASGLLRLETAPMDVAAMRDRLARLHLPPAYVQVLSAQEASARCGWPLQHPAWWYPGGGWVQPGALARSFLERAGERTTLRANVRVDSLARGPKGWQLLDERGATLAEAEHVVLANAGDALRLLRPWMPPSTPDAWPMRAVRGQISIGRLDHMAGLRLPHVPVTGSGYLLPAFDNEVIFGATSQTDDHDPAVRNSDHLHNLAQLSRLSGVNLGPSADVLRGRTGWRWSTDDRLPVLGLVPDLAAAALVDDLEQPNNVPRLTGLHACTAFGSRGITWAALAAQVVAASISGAPLPIEASLRDCVDAARFVSRQSRRCA